MADETPTEVALNLDYFIVVHPDPSTVSKIVSAFRQSGWALHGELQTFSGISEDGFPRVHYVQVVIK